jgi:hypothetical protein
MQNIKSDMPARSTLLIIATSLITALSSCNRSTSLEGNEVVMCESMQIHAGDHHAITITAIDAVTRNYKTDSLDVTERLIPRSERWYGSSGLYKPTGTHALHMVLEEGQQHFHSADEAMDWLASGTYPKGTHIKYTPDGLVAVWAHSQNVLRVAIWQIYIQGNKPTNLDGASMSGLINVSMPHDKSRECAEVGNFTPSAPEIIGGRLFSGRSLDLMKERGVSANAIEKVISHGSASHLGDYTIYLNNDSFADPSMVKVNATGAVITII